MLYEILALRGVVVVIIIIIIIIVIIIIFSSPRVFISFQFPRLFYSAD